MKRFEDRIRDKRNELDTESPDIDAMWAVVDHRVNGGSGFESRVIWRWVAAAACVIIVFGLGYWTALQPDEDPPITVAELDPAIGQQTDSLQREFEQKYAQLASYDFTEEDVAVFKRELDEIDRLEAELRNMLGTVKHQDRALRLLIDHHQKRIRVIERMIKKLEKKERNENRKRDEMA